MAQEKKNVVDKKVVDNKVAKDKEVKEVVRKNKKGEEVNPFEGGPITFHNPNIYAGTNGVYPSRVGQL